jgi:hypothetical protein
MPSVNTWISHFLAGHRLRFGGDDWPAQGTETNKQFVRMWIEAFKLENVEEWEADLASVRLGTLPPRFRTDHLPAVIGMVREMRKQFRPTDIPESQDKAATESRNCPYCSSQGAGNWTGAMGFVYVYHPLYYGSRVLNREDTPEAIRHPIKAIVHAHCVCALGRWMKERTPKGLVVDLQDVLDRRSRWLLDDPSDDNRARGRAQEKPAVGFDANHPPQPVRSYDSVSSDVSVP